MLVTSINCLNYVRLFNFYFIEIVWKCFIGILLLIREKSGHKVHAWNPVRVKHSSARQSSLMESFKTNKFENNRLENARNQIYCVWMKSKTDYDTTEGLFRRRLRRNPCGTCRLWANFSMLPLWSGAPPLLLLWMSRHFPWCWMCRGTLSRSERGHGRMKCSAYKHVEPSSPTENLHYSLHLIKTH